MAIGSASATWKGSASLIWAAGIHGRSKSRTITRWLPTPSTTSLLSNLACDHSWRSAVATIAVCTTSPSRTAPSGSGTSPYRTSVAGFLPRWASPAELELGCAYGGRSDVQPDDS